MEKFLNGKYAFVAIFLLAFFQYANTLKHDYAWDDVIVITENTRVQKGLSDIPALFENIRANKTEFRYGYRPITLLSFAAEVQFFGLDPHVSHFTNTALYALLCCMLLFFLSRLFPDKRMVLFLAVALYAVHPLHTEVVANIKSRDELLAMLFGLGAMLNFHRYMLNGNLVRLVFTFSYMVLAFLSKESAVTFIGVLVLIFFYFFGKMEKRRWVELGAILSMFLMLIAVRAYVFSDQFFQSNDQELMDKGMFHYDVFLGNQLVDVTSKIQLLGNSFHLIFLYIKQFVYPWPLLHDYGYHHIETVSWSNVITWMSALLVFGLVGLTLAQVYKRTLLGFGLAFFFINISIYMHLVALAPDMYAERFIFVSSLGLCLATVDVVGRVRFPHKIIAPLIGIAVCVVFFGTSLNRNKAWKDNQTLQKTDLPYLQDCVRALYNYAIERHGQYYTARESEKPAIQKDILTYYEKTLELTDRLFVVYMDLGGAYMEFGYPEKGKRIFEEAAEKFWWMSVPFVQLGKYHMTFSRFEEAIPFFEKAVSLGDANSDYYYLLAICQFNTNKHDAAIKTLVSGESKGVSSSAYHSLMGKLYQMLGQEQDAINAVNRGLKLYPNDLGLRSELEAIMLQ